MLLMIYFTQNVKKTESASLQVKSSACAAQMINIMPYLSASFVYEGQ